VIPEILWLLALIAAVGGACFYAGRLTSVTTLEAARKTFDVATMASDRFATYGSTLDAVRAEMAKLNGAIEASIKVSAEHHRAVEDSLLTLFQGLERAGLARSPRSTPRQVGESDSG
jgi:hypothetical protein